MRFPTWMSPGDVMVYTVTKANGQKITTKIPVFRRMYFRTREDFLYECQAHIKLLNLRREDV